ncbi:MAG: DUF4349 domain-containing protein [Clostridia bacterium]|nr:DUF4349 domain-containing protein [Clostridia bacterium]
MKKLFAILLCIVMAVSLAACGAKMSNDMAVQDMEYFSAADSAGGIFYNTSESLNGKVELQSDSVPNEDGEAPQTNNEKIIKTVEAYVQTKEYDKYISSLTANVSANGGYVEKSDANMGGYYDSNRHSTYVLRIPADKLDAFMVSAEENGKITSKTETQQNVTLEYVDVESRISAYKTEKETLTNLLEKAASLENVLAIQERLSEVNYQIENYTAQLRVLENRVSYSTVTLHINEVERVSEAEPTLWQRIKNEFLDNIDNLKEGFEDFAVAIIGGLPVIIPVIAIAIVAIIIIKKLIKKRKAKKNISQ